MNHEFGRIEKSVGPTSSSYFCKFADITSKFIQFFHRIVPLMCQTLHRKNIIVIFFEEKHKKKLINTIIYFGRGMKIQSWCLVFITSNYKSIARLQGSIQLNN